MSSGSGPATAIWVFGYGSLVDPESLGRTLARPVTPGVDFVEAELSGWGRRWNYGVGHVRASWERRDGTLIADGVIVALGVVSASGESANGIIARVSDLEIGALDMRERDYDRVDVTESVALLGDRSRCAFGTGDRVVTYVPRASAIERYEAARDCGRAGIRSTYWGLVDAAFAVFGTDQLQRYRSSTPAPDVPVVRVAGD
jgi:cation transport regulator ChaC